MPLNLTNSFLAYLWCITASFCHLVLSVDQFLQPLMVVLQQSIKTLCFLLSLKDSFYKHEFGNPYLLLCEYFIFHIMNTKRLKYPSLSSAWSSGTSNPLPHLQSPEGHSIFYPHFQLTRFSEGGSKCYFPGDKWIDFPWSCNSSNGSNRIQWFSWGVSCIGTLIIIFFLGWGVGGGGSG